MQGRYAMSDRFALPMRLGPSLSGNIDGAPRRQVCLATLTEHPDVDSVWWEFSACYCVDCTSSQVSKSIPTKLEQSLHMQWEHVFLSTPSQQIRKFMDVFLATESLEERRVLLQTHAIMEHWRLCRAWAHKKVQLHINQ
ncbi:hypothetical protein B0H10DRAFT_2435130 [Mycena sp. CBHHK59/15]|nr:hypothetical protein B0H10DRAFT_2435130 [Mycena sp. CBHHK59/15]